MFKCHNKQCYNKWRRGSRILWTPAVLVLNNESFSLNIDDEKRDLFYFLAGKGFTDFMNFQIVKFHVTFSSQMLTQPVDFYITSKITHEVMGSGCGYLFFVRRAKKILSMNLQYNVWKFLQTRLGPKTDSSVMEADQKNDPCKVSSP